MILFSYKWRFLCINQRASNAAVMAECERYPIYIETQMRCLKYWLKVIVMPEHRLVKQCYNMLKPFDMNGQTNWVSNFRRMPSLNGFGYIWERQYVNNKTMLISQFHQRLQDQYLQEWHSQLQESSKLYFYKLLKSSYYLDTKCISEIRKFRYYYMSLKISTIGLEIQT